MITADGKKVIFHELDVSECDSSNITITLMYDEDGNPEFAQYDFDQAVIYSDYAKRNEYRHDGWNYGD